MNPLTPDSPLAHPYENPCNPSTPEVSFAAHGLEQVSPETRRRHALKPSPAGLRASRRLQVMSTRLV